MDDNVLGAAVRLLRAKAGLSQREVALLTGINNATISRMESGEQSIKARQLEKILEACKADWSQWQGAIELVRSSKVVEREDLSRAPRRGYGG